MLSKYSNNGNYQVKKMPAIRIIDRDTRSPKRRPKLWETFGLIGINPNQVKDGKGVFYAIVKQEQVDQILDDDSKEKFKQNGFEITQPIEYEAVKSVVVRHVDKVISEYDDDDVIGSINHANTWAQVEKIVRIVANGGVLKVTFKSTAMVQTALDKGFVILHQRINPNNIEKELFVRVTPCYNCFQYNHKTGDCPTDKQVICSFCGQPGHKFNECKEETPKCINCKGKHRTLAAVCKVRRDYIKDKGKELRAKSRTRSQTRANTTFTQLAGGTANVPQMQTTPQIQTTINQMNKEEVKALITKIIASITFVHYNESLKEGTFQSTVDEMFQLNNLPRVKFPTKIVTEGITDLFNDSVKDDNVNMTASSHDQTTVDNVNKNQNEQESKVTESTKRNRDSGEFPTKKNEEKRKKENEQQVRQSTVTHNACSTFTLPKPVRGCSRMVSPRPKGQNLNVKDIGIMVYLKRSLKHKIDLNDMDSRETIREIILKGGAKIQWRHPNVVYEAIHTGILNRVIRIEDISVTKLPDDDFKQMQNKCINLNNDS